MIGKRVYPDKEGNLILSPGDYGQELSGEWLARLPSGHTGSLKDHEVTEHEDGTITVYPSIYVNAGARGQYHGYLKHGEWTL